MQKKISLLLIFMLLIVSTSNVFASAQSNQYNEEGSFKIYDDTIEEYLEVKIIEVNELGSRVQAKDSRNNIIYDYSYNLNDNSFYNHITNETEYLNESLINSDIPIGLENNDFNVMADYVFCDIGDERSSEFSISVIALTSGGLLASSVIIVKLAGAIAAYIGVAVGVVEGVGAAAFTKAAFDVIDAARDGDWGRSVYFTQHFKCSYMCSFDPFEGNVCFYGYDLDSITYNGIR